MAGQQYRKVAYGLSDALISVFPAPILANRAPNTTDKAQIGAIWIFVANNAPYILTSIVNNLATWELLLVSGGAGVFTTITSTGAFTLDTTTAAANTLGNTTGNTSIAMSVGTGGFTLDGVAASNYAIGASTTTGTISIGGTAQTGNIVLGNSTAAQSVIIGAAAGAGSSNVSIAAGVPGNTVLINNGTNTGANVTNINNGPAGANSTVNILSGTATAGTQTFNVLATGATRAGVVNIGTGAAAHVVSIGSNTGAASTLINGGTGGVEVSAPFLNLFNAASTYIYNGAGAPANGLALHVGDMYINTTAATAATRLYIATGVGAWTNVTCAA